MVKIDWNEFSKDVETLAAKLKPFDFEGFLAVERGGLIPAAKLAYMLGIKHIHAIKIDSPYSLGDHDSWLIIDDIVDTGRTILTLRNVYKRTRIATVYARETSRHSTDFYGKIIRHEEWLSFPWEDKNG